MDTMLLAAKQPNNNVSADSSWDLETFFNNSANYSQVAGGAFLGFMGMVAVIWGGFLLVRKLMSGQQNQDNWLKIVALLVLGGAMVFSGVALLLNVAKGGQDTVKGFGNGGK